MIVEVNLENVYEKGVFYELPTLYGHRAFYYNVCNYD